MYTRPTGDPSGMGTLTRHYCRPMYAQQNGFVVSFESGPQALREDIKLSNNKYIKILVAEKTPKRKERNFEICQIAKKLRMPCV